MVELIPVQNNPSQTGSQVRQTCARQLAAQAATDWALVSDQACPRACCCCCCTHSPVMRALGVKAAAVYRMQFDDLAVLQETVDNLGEEDQWECPECEDSRYAAPSLPHHYLMDFFFFFG